MIGAASLCHQRSCCGRKTCEQRAEHLRTIIALRRCDIVLLEELAGPSNLALT